MALVAAGPLQPPADIAVIIDKTATFVARNGPEFENRIRAEQNSAKFSFLQPNDPFHPYYRAKLAELGGGAFDAAALAAAVAPAAARDAASVSKASTAVKPGGGAGRGGGAMVPGGFRGYGGPTITPVEPPKPLFTASTRPIGASPLEIETIQLTAQFVAGSGRAFLGALTAKEEGNPQFGFLKPTHHLFQYFAALIEAYTKVLTPPAGALEQLKLESADSMRTLARVQGYAAHHFKTESAKRTKQEEE